MATSFFGGSVFDGEFFAESPKIGAKDSSRRSIIKPTGLLPYRVRQRVVETQRIHEEVVAEVAKEFTEVQPVETMSLQQIEAEIGSRLRQKLRTTDEEALLLLMLVAVAG